MTVFGAGTMIGGPVAGWLADHYGWPLSFLVQVSGSRSFATRCESDTVTSRPILSFYSDRDVAELMLIRSQ